jgi:hypothetical protein
MQVNAPEGAVPPQAFTLAPQAFTTAWPTI